MNNTQAEPSVRESFEEWLNRHRDSHVSSVFHEIVLRFDLAAEERDALTQSQRAEIERLREILQKLVDDLGEGHDDDDFEAECPSCQLVKAARAALKPEQE